MASNPLDSISSPVAPSQPQARPIPRTIMGPPREAPLHTQQTPAEQAIDSNRAATGPADVRRGNAEAIKAEADARAALAAEERRNRDQGTVEDARSELTNVIDAAHRAIQLSREGGVSGRDRWVGNATRAMGGTALNDLEGALDTIRANIAFTRLQRMRQESPTGGAVGNVSDSDLRLLSSTIASLDRSQSDDQFESNLRRVIDAYGRVYQRLGGDPARIGPEGIPSIAANAIRNGTIQPPAATPPGTPPTDPNRVQPGESMGQVGTLPIGPPDTGHMEVSTQDSFRPNLSRAQAAAQFRAAYARGANRDELIGIMEQIGPLNVDQRAWIDANTTPDARRYWQQHGNNIIGREWFGQNEQMSAPRAAAASMSASPAGTFAINAFDAGSLGLPGLFSEEYRNRLAEVRARDPGTSIAGSLVGGIVAPGGPRPGMGLGMQSVRSGGQGLLYGLNSSGGDIENALIGGGIGAALPGAFNIAGRGLRTTRNFLVPRGNYADPEAQALARAFDEEGVPGSRPILDPASRDRMAYLDASAGSGNAIREGLEATRSGIEARADQLGRGGTAQEPGTMGDIIQNAGRRDLRNERGRLSRDYERAGQMADGAPIYGREFVAEINDQIAILSRSPSRNRAVIRYLNDIKRDFVDESGELIPRTIDDFRSLRTDLSGEISRRSLTQTPAERLVSRALDRARADIHRDLNDIHSLNPGTELAQRRQGAWELYRRTDLGWQQQARFRRQVLDRIIGPEDAPKLGGDVMAQIRALAAGDNAQEASRISRLWRSLSPSEAADTAATIAHTLGRASPDEAFSPAKFIANTRRIQPSARATIFGEAGARSIANLRAISEAYKQTFARLNNSRSGMVRNWNAQLRDLVRGGPVGIAAGLVSGGSAVATGAAGLALGAASAGAGMVLRRLSARALMNNDLSRWLAMAPRATTPSAIRAHIERLQPLARLSRNQAVSQEILGLRQALLNAVNDNASAPMRAVAEPDDSGPAGGNDR